jgi:HEAT repeat protein
MEARGYGTDAAGLERALRNGDEVAVRAEAAFLLGYQQAQQAKGALRSALSDSSARVRVEAALALARLGDLETALPVLKREANGKLFEDAPLRAARALAILGDSSGYARVMEALQSEFPSNRMEAIAVLPAFMAFEGEQSQDSRVDVVDALIRGAHDAEPLLRRDALRALGQIDDPRARTAIAETARSDPDEQVRAFAAGLLSAET